ncbi:hypothetical protein C4K68_19815 [Pokkaliibacter plantistimulans]|uniref:Integrase catalytic domain-containing protein n=1 Tax=Proteobacteria bacterium 228 TaxID=2083153 RepID=A0A2S5KL60_9PROT|nr:hypothetical protein C4K68_19815 [Pokkaliibacter plantistimulans]
MERLFRSVKSEWVPKCGYTSLDQAIKDMGDYLMSYYNEQRPHCHNGGLTPVMREKEAKKLRSCPEIVDHYSTAYMHHGITSTVRVHCSCPERHSVAPIELTRPIFNASAERTTHSARKKSLAVGNHSDWGVGKVTIGGSRI